MEVENTDKANVDEKVDEIKDTNKEETKAEVTDKKEVKDNEVKKEDTVNKEETDKKKDTKNLDTEETNKTIEELTKQLNNANEKAIELDNVKKELDTVKAEVTKATETVKEYETLLNKMIEEKMKAIPQEFAELVPSNMTIPQQLEWLTKAESKNLFNTNKNVADVEIGKPMNAKVDKVDTSKLNGSGILSLAYNTLKR